MLLGAAASIVVVLFGVLWWGVLPSKVEARAKRALEARTGLSVHIGGVSMRPRGAVLRDVTLRSAERELEVELDAVGVRVGVFSALGGDVRVEGGQIEGGRVRMDLGAPTIGDVLAGILDRGESGAASEGEGSARRRPAIEVSGLDVELRDGEGTLVSSAGVSVRRDGEELRVASARAELGGGEGDRILLERMFVSFERPSDGPLRVRGLVAERGEVRWAARLFAEGEDEEESESQPELMGRLAAAVRLVRDARGGGEEESRGEDEGSGWSSRLSPDLRVDLGDLTFHGRAPDGSEATIRFSELSFGYAEDGRLHSVGASEGGPHGEARWNLVFDPATAKAEGDLRFDSLPIGFVAPLVPFLPIHPTPDARLSADVRLNVSESSDVEIEGRIAVADVALSSRRFSDRPVTGVSAALEGEGTWHPAERRLVWKSGHLRMGEVAVRLAGELAITDEAYRVQFEAVVPGTPCQAIVDAIPEDVLGPVASLQLAGTIGGRVRLSVDSRDLAATEVDLHVADGCDFISVPQMAEVYRFERPFAHQVVEPDGTVFTMTTGPGSANWISLAAIHPNIVAAILSHEDASFYRHAGFAPWAIREALVRNLEAGAFRYGASTISMQLTKNLFLRREKTLVRKVQEVFLTWWLERALRKESILELYLNVIEYGPGVYGIRNATRHYFGREPSDVSPAEAAFIAHVLPAPKRYAGAYHSGAPSESTLRRMESFLRHMNGRGRLSAEALDYALAELPRLRFHREGDPPPPSRVLPGDGSAFARGSEDAPSDDDLWAVPDFEDDG